MNVVILVPRRDDHGHRDALWAWCKARWAAVFPDLPIYEGHQDEGPFNRSMAVNRAATEAGAWDLAIVIDSDIFIKRSQVLAALERATTTGRVTWAHRRWRGLHEDAVPRILADRFDVRQDFGPELERADMDLLVERTNPISWSCCVVIPRPVWDDLGGFDERFKGWGWEDMALQSAIVGLYGYERIEGDVYHLWHPRSAERIVKGNSRATASKEYVVNARLGRRYMVALRRDHGETDRSLRSDPAEMARDVANLVGDDAKYAAVAHRYGLPDWADWWPTLEELRDGAKDARAGRPSGPSTSSAPTVTLAVHSGGSPEAWPERRAYLEQSLASLTDHLTGPIVQRVLYSDWGPEVGDELRIIAERFGLYVVGGGHRGYSASMQALWSYLDRRAIGDFVFQAEDDFLYDADVDLVPMIEILTAHPYLRQLALLRGAFYPRELEAGGILAEHPDEYEHIRANGHSRVEHRLYFTANPSLFRRSLCRTPWPKAESSERVYTTLLNRDPESRFAYWGDGTPVIRHIGAKQAGSGY